MDHEEQHAEIEEVFAGLPERQAAFLRVYLDASSLDTYLQAGAAAESVGLTASYGSTLKAKLAPRIRAFLALSGLDPESLRAKTVELLYARETKVVTLKGKVEEWALYPGSRILARSCQTTYDRQGNPREEHLTVVGVDVPAKDLQRRALDMAIRLTTGYAPERLEHSGPDGGPIELTNTERAARIAGLLDTARARRAGSATGSGGSTVDPGSGTADGGSTVPG